MPYHIGLALLPFCKRTIIFSEETGRYVAGLFCMTKSACAGADLPFQAVGVKTPSLNTAEERDMQKQ